MAAARIACAVARRLGLGVLCAALLACGPFTGRSQVPPPKPWFERSLVGMEVGPTGAQFGNSDSLDTRYCARFDGRKIVRSCAAAHAQYLVLWARDGDYAYYDSRLLPKAPSLGGRDPLRDAVEEGRKYGLPVLAYCVVQQGGHYLQAHPEFEMRGVDGKPLGRFCYNSGYLDAMKGIVAEQLACGIAGFHIDMVDQGFGPPYGCWCDHCKRKFAAEYGHPMPAGAHWDAAWDEMLEFRYRSSQEFEIALRAYIRSVNPRATVDFNYHGNPPFSWEVGQRPVQHAGNADFVTGETGQWGFSALGVGMNAEFYRASTPGRPFQVAMQRGVRMYHDQTTRPLADIRWELFTLLAHGAFVTMVDKTGFDGRLDPAAYERIGAAFREAREKRSEFGQRPVYDVGLYFSARSRDWTGRDRPAGYFQGFEGAYKACVYSHLMCGVLLDENVTLEKLKRFPAVVLPGVTIVSEKEAAIFTRYVEEGGRLLVTGQSGQFGSLGEPLAASSLEKLIGARVARRLDTRDNWVDLDTRSTSGFTPMRSSIRTDWNFLVEGPATVYEPTAAAPIGTLLKPFRTTRQKQGREPPDWPMSADSPVGPAALFHAVGKGAVLTLACSPDYTCASDHYITEARYLLRNAILLLHPRRRVTVAAPANVESVVTDDSATRTLRVHFIAYNALPQTTPAHDRPYVLPGLAEEAPLFRASIRADVPLKSARAWNRATKCALAGDTVSVTINDIHEVISLRY
ncbi:MAG TPA: hypothetical protein VKT77_12090 [Chthonomonadaceae bacterium]|nr:hypothetical protein [Chthonomonadaceae bacterium]